MCDATGLGQRVMERCVFTWQSLLEIVRTGQRLGADRDLDTTIPKDSPGTHYFFAGRRIGRIVGLPGDRVNNRIYFPGNRLKGSGPVVYELINTKIP